MTIRKEFTGMLSVAILQFEELLAEVADLNPVITKGYDVTEGKDSFFYWGVACRIAVAPDDMGKLEAEAERLGIAWLGNGEMAFTNGLTIEDFQTYRVNGNLELTPEQEG